MSDAERRNVNISLAAFAVVLIGQAVALSWWAATLQANVTNHEERLDILGPRIEILEQDFYRRGGSR